MQTLLNIPKLPISSTNLYNEGYTLLYPTLSIYNQYIPIPALSTGTVFYPKGEDIATTERRVLSYSLRYSPVTNYRVGNFEEFAGWFTSTQVRMDYRTITHANITRRYAINHSVLLHIDETRSDIKIHPLMLLTVKRDFLFTVSKPIPNPKHLCLVIDNKFESDEEHFKLYRNIDRHCISKLSPLIDVVRTNDILNLCYNKGLSMPKFKTIDETMNHFSSINNTIFDHGNI